MAERPGDSRTGRGRPSGARRLGGVTVVVASALLAASCSLVGRLPFPGQQPPSPVTGGATTEASSAPATSTAPSASPSSGVPSGTPTPTVARSSVPMPSVTPKGFRTPPPGQGLARYVQQKVNWQSCGDGLECAEVAVPLDYAKPDDVAITLAVKRAPGGSGVQGSLFINPGGPGGSGWSMVDNFAGAFTGQFDIVGWDPRGVGRSTPVECENGAALDDFYDLDSSPDDAAEEAALVDGTRAFALSCLKLSGRLLEHVSTVETVRDLDLLRQLVGDNKLNFLGYSYGTQIGATYAQLFGKNIGRMVLDSAVNITEDTSIIQAQGFDRSLEHFAEWCAAGNCEFGSSSEEVIRKITSFFDELDSKPLAVGNRKLTQSLAALGVLTPLYQDESVWPRLRQALSRALAGDGSGLLGFADSYNQRESDGTYGQMLFGFNAVRCLDEGDPGIDGARQQAEKDAKQAPVFGRYLGADLFCPVWPVAAQPSIGKITGPGAPPILVVGTTGDSATPYEYATWMAAQLQSGVLLTHQGEGHGAFGGSNMCVNRTVINYLTRGTVPAKGTVCS